MKSFHKFRLDTLNHSLWREEERVPIAPKTFDVLRFLVENAGNLVSADDLLEAIWPDTYVNPEILRKYILEIRNVLGDRRDGPIFIETQAKRGYRFVAPVEEFHPAPLPTSAAADSRFVGREGSLAALDGFLQAALNGLRKLVFVTGEAGIGKTTLVDVFQQRAARHPAIRIGRGQCVEGFGGKEAYYPILEAFGQLARDGDKKHIVEILAARAPTWLIQFPSLVKAEQTEALQREILGATRERMVREICEALEVLTAKQPLILVFEDLHWVDHSTLDVVSALARRREAAKLLLLSTYRPADAHGPLEGLVRDLEVHRLCEEIAIDRLEEGHVARYLAAEFDVGSVPSDLSNLVYRHTGGNALFMVTIVQNMVDKGLIVQDEGKWRLTEHLKETDLDVPETLQRMLEVQLEQLSEPEKRILKSASAVGERFSVWAVTSTLEIAPDHVEDLCEGLVERQQFIRPIGIHELPDGSVSAHYEFRHALYRQAIYRSLSDVSRSRLHSAIAEGLRNLFTSSGRDRELATELAFHFELGHEYELAVHYLLIAAENAGGRFAYRDAIEILQQAVKLTPRVALTVGAELESRILELIGDAYYALGAMAESAKAYETGASRAAQNGIKALQVSALTSLMRPYGLIDPDRGIAAIDEATHVCREVGDPLLLARTEMLAAASRLLYDLWRKEDADVVASAHRTIRDRGDAETPPYHQMLYAYVQALQGRYREALRVFESFTTKIDASTSLMTFLFALTGKTVSLLYLGQFGEVLRVVRAGRETAEKNANDPWLFNFREAWLRTLAFDFEGARRVCELITRAGPKYPTGQPETIARIAGGYAELDRQNYDHAIEYFRQVIDPKITPKFFLHWFWRLTARLGLSQAWLEAGDVAKARAEADVLLEFARSTPNPYLRTLAWEMKSRIAIADEDWIGARNHTDQGLAVLEKFDVPVAAWRVHATAWDLFLHAKDLAAAEAHRARAEAHILTIANSFGPDEPLRRTFLEAAPVRRILKPRQRTTKSGSGR